MSFQLRADESAAKGVRRVTRKQLEGALERLGAAGPDADEAVHDVRKRLKRLRAVLRLARDGIGDKVYDRENACFRDTARPLSEVRDAQALRDALDGLLKRFAESEHSFGPVREGLRRRQDEARARVLGDGRAPVKAAAALGEARRRADDWARGFGGWSALGKGLKRLYRAGRRAFRAARGAPTDANLHEWRKQTKYLWHGFQFLQGLRPGVLGPAADRAHDLGGRLGDDHDLAVLRGLVLGDVDHFPEREPSLALLALIDRRRAELQREAYALGRRLYRETPGDLARRLHRYWRAWRTEARAAAGGR
jgi:CHAD domain-containing protein